MDNNMVPRAEYSIPINSEVEIADKPELVRELESYDLQNLTPENIDRMVDIVQDYLIKNYPANPEFVKQIPDHIILPDAEKFKELFTKDPNNDINDAMNCPGFYDSDLDKIIINVAGMDEVSMLMSTIFHESLHFVSLKNGAGFGGNDFLIPDELQDDEMGPIGQHTLIEGTTQIFARMAVFDLGFEDSMSMWGYPAEIYVMGGIFDSLPEETLEELYFNTPMDEIRIQLENKFEPEGSSVEITPEVSNGVFGNVLHDIGVATFEMQKTLDSWDETLGLGDVVDKIKQAVAYYYEQEGDV